MLFWHIFGAVAVCIVVLVIGGLGLSRVLGRKFD